MATLRDSHGQCANCRALEKSRWFSSFHSDATPQEGATLTQTSLPAISADSRGKRNECNFPHVVVGVFMPRNLSGIFASSLQPAAKREAGDKMARMAQEITAWKKKRKKKKKKDGVITERGKKCRTVRCARGGNQHSFVIVGAALGDGWWVSWNPTMPPPSQAH